MWQSSIVKISVSNLDIDSGARIVSFYLFCYFTADIPNGALLELLESDETTIIDSVHVNVGTTLIPASENQSYVIFDLTKYIQNHRSSASFDSIYLRIASLPSPQTTMTFINYSTFASGQSNEDSAYYSLSFLEKDGLCDSYTYSDFGLGASGTAKIKLFDGNLFFFSPLLIQNLVKTSAALSLCYNGDAVDENKGFGYGWNMSFCYHLTKALSVITLTDYTGQKKKFRYLTEDDKKSLHFSLQHETYYCHEDGSYIYKNSLFSNKYFYVTPDKTKITFALVSLLGEHFAVEAIETSNGDIFEFTYDVLISLGRIVITKIVSPDDEIEFYYDENNSYRLESIESKKKYVETEFTYINNLLTSIKTYRKKTEPFSNVQGYIRTLMRSSSFTYDTNKKLLSITNEVEKAMLSFTYSSSKVSQVVERPTESINNLTIHDKQTQFSYDDEYTEVTNCSGYSQYYYFDRYGLTTLMLDSNVLAYNFRYGVLSSLDDDNDCHTLLNAHAIAVEMKNLITNGSFETTGSATNGWQIDSNNTNCTYQKSLNSLFGDNCLTITNNSNSLNCVLSQSITVSKFGSYSFSGLSKIISGSGGTCYFKVTVQYYEMVVVPGPGSSGSTLQTVLRTNVYEIPFSDDDSNWHFEERNNILMRESSNVLVEVIIPSNYCVAIDDIVLSQSTRKNEHNWIRNNNFEALDNSSFPSNWIMNSGSNFSVVDVSNVNQSELHDLLFYDNVLRVPSSTSPTENIIYQSNSMFGLVGDTITFGVWFKGCLTLSEHAAILIQIHNTHNSQNVTTKEYSTFAVKNIDSWQIISGTIIADIPFDSVTIKLIHYGFHVGYFEGAFLYTNHSSVSLNYNQNASAASLSNDKYISKVRLNDKAEKVSESNEKQETISYKYDNNGKLIQAVDEQCSVVEFTNSEHGTIRRITNNGQYIETEEESVNGLLIKKDQFGFESRDVFDCFGNKVSYIDSNGTVIRKEFNDDFRVTLVERANISGKVSQAKISYNHLGCPTSIIAPNGTTYLFEYDDYGRITESYMNNVLIESRTYTAGYSSSYHKPISETTVNSTTDVSSYSIDKDFIISKNFNNQEQYHFNYDCYSRLSHYRRILNNEEGFISYDDNSNIISEILSNGNSYYIQRDNLDNIGQETINIDGETISHDFIRDYQFNDKIRRPLFDKLEDFYDFDVVFFGQSIEGEYGIETIDSNHDTEFDSSFNGNLLKLNHDKNPIVYDLEMANSLRSAVFPLESWRNSFTNTKVFVGVLKSCEVSYDKPVFAFYNDDSEEKLSLYINGIHSCFIKYNNQTSSQNINSINLINNWLSIQLFVSNTNIKLFINGISVCSISYSGDLVSELSKLTIGGGLLDTVSINTDVLYFAIGASSTFSLLTDWLHNDNLRLIDSYSANNHYKYAGVHSYCLDNPEVDLITLDETFKSVRGLSPKKLLYNRTVLNSKNDLFVWDNNLKRHVYHADSIGDTCLVYNFTSLSTLKIKLDFYLYSAHSSNRRTIVSFAQTNVVGDVFWFSLLIKNSYLCFRKDGVDTEICSVSNYSWNTIYLEISFPYISVQLNGLNMTSFNTGSPVVGYNVYFGCSRNESSNPNIVVPTDFLLGNIKDILFANSSSINLNILSIHNGFLIKKYDSFGRKTNVLSTNYQKTISYEQPVDGEGDSIPNRTSTRVSGESDSLNNSVTYKYDAVGNLIQKVINNDTFDYSYDYAYRLISSESSTLVSEYIYDDNGDIQSIFFDDGNNTNVRDFSYDSQTGRLSSITENYVTINYTYPSQSSLYPSSIGDMSLVWYGKLLHCVNVNNQNYVYEYDYQDRRIEKITNSSVTKYFYDNNKLISEKTGTTTIIYKYDESNRLFGFDVITSSSRDSYTYLKDEFGVINGILNDIGTQVATYVYDDFGRIISSSGNSTVLSLNHIIYKDYYFDNETGFYLLGRRYYYPYSCRFISPDDIDYLIVNNIDKCQFNLFSYCDNNPILYSDPSGHSLLLTILITLDSIVIPTLVMTVGAALTTGALLAATGQAIASTTVLALPIFTEIMVDIDAKTHGLDKTERAKQANQALARIIKGVVHYGALWLKGRVFGDQLLMDEAVSYFMNAFPFELREYVECTFIGLLSIADSIHNMLTNYSEPICAVIGVLNPILGLAAVFGSSLYNATTTNNSEDNLEHNIIQWSNILSDPDSDVFCELDRFGDKSFIDYQNSDSLLLIRFGFSNINDSGCGIIATYNALLALDKITPNDFPKLINYFEKKNLLFGVLGAFPSHIGQIMEDIYGVDTYEINNVETINSVNSIFRTINPEYGLIITFFNQGGTDDRDSSDDDDDPYYDALSMHTVTALVYSINGTEVEEYYILNGNGKVAVDDLIDENQTFEIGLYFEVCSHEND